MDILTDNAGRRSPSPLPGARSRGRDDYDIQLTRAHEGQPEQGASIRVLVATCLSVTASHVPR